MLGQIIGVILLVLTIPVNIDYINTFLQKPSAHISNVELEGLSLLKERKEGVVFGAFHIIDGKQLSPLSESSYISAFSGKQEYIADETQLELTRIDYKERKTKVRNMDCSFLEEVDYIYYNHKYSRDLFTRCAKELDRFTKIFHKEDIQIYEKI